MTASTPAAHARVDELERLGDLVRQDDHVRGQVHPHAAQVREPAGIGERLEGEVLGASARVELVDAEVDRVGAVGDGGPERVGAARGREQFGTVCGCMRGT